jgi:phytol kinase
VEGSRKLIHIGVSNWWILAMLFFKNRLYAAVVPAVFILLNYLSYRYNIVKSMERGEGKNDLGTVYFPISLLVLVLFSFSSFSSPYVGGLGILTMGYGDGLAAVVGKKLGRRKFFIAGKERSIEGSLTMFAASFAAVFILLFFYSPADLLLKSLVCAGFATLIEAFSPYGLDNLTVPILTSVMYQILFF